MSPASGRTSSPTPQVLAVSADARERLTALYRERDERDAQAYKLGMNRVRGKLYALGLERLEAGGHVYEAYSMLAAAGVDMSSEALRRIESLPQNWRHVCRIDTEGRVWTASLAEKRSGRGAS